MRFLILVLGFNICFSALYSQDPILVAKASGRPLIDGKLDDEVWKTLPRYSDFKSYVPDFGSPAAFATIAMITYDEENLYIGFDCKDPEPDKLKATITARDQIKNEDWVCINFDPFFDQQSLICIYVNPRGIQMDGRSSSNQEDLGADYVFESKASIQPDGYQVEIEIPFKSLRYQRKEPVTMGFIFERRIQRLSQQATYPPLNPDQGMNFLTQGKGFSFVGIRHYTLIELLPALTYSFKQQHENGIFGITANKPSIGLTGTVGINSQLILDMAINPDFSQVESDAGQISENQRYALYYPEKRPFFQEGKDNFDIAATSEMGFFQQAFHTRQIINPLAGIKLTGKITNHDRIGFLYALDDPFEGTAGDSVNTFINYAIGRLHHSFNDDSYIGAIATDREGSGIYNRVGGIDGRWRLNPSTSLKFNALGSGTVSAPGANKKTDWMGTVSLSKNTNRLSGDFQIQHIGGSFITQSGFLLRSGINNMTVYAAYSFYRDKGFFRKLAPNFYGFLNQDIRSGLWERDFGVGMSASGQRSTQISFFFNPSDEVYLNQRFRTHSFHLNGSSQVIQSLRIKTQYQFGYRTRYVEGPYTGWGTTASLSINFQPFKKFQSDLILNYSDFYQIENPVREFSYLIIRNRNTFQLTSKLFVRGIVEYNSYEKDLSTDFLVSFTYIPGTVVHIGYGSLYQKVAWNGHEYQPGSDYLETIRGVFFKASYLWRN
ncbi:MAG: hypothetical protein D4R64_00310 [Porphyromonadaceae bacterium]|nr:MAG: hypothetical protein D4R64_00310 [Porphyromonadaceae bacterium]